MSESKIPVSKALSKKIIELRKKSGLKASEVAEQISKSTGWISLVQNNKISSIDYDILKQLFAVLLSVSLEEAEQYLNNFLEQTSANNLDSTDSKVVIYRYDEENKILTEESFEEMLERVNEIFKQIFEADRKYAFDSLGQLMENLSFDTGLTLAINQFPLSSLGNTDHKTRQHLFNELGDVIKKYLDEYAPTKNDDLD